MSHPPRAMAAMAGLALVIAACATPTPPPATATPSPVATPTATATPKATPYPTPAGDVPYAVVEPSEPIRSVAGPPGRHINVITCYGPHVVFDDQDRSAAGNGILVADLETGTLRTLAERPPGVVLGWPDSDGRTIVWQEAGTGTWEVVALDIASGATHVVASGTDTGPGAPQVAGDYVTLNRPRPGFGAVIEVHALADGRLLREIPVRDPIEIPDLDDDGTVVYTTGPLDEPSGAFSDNTLYVARPGEEPQAVARHAFGATISGGRIAWLHDETGSARGQEVWTTAPGEPAHRLGVPNTGWQGAYWVDAGDRLVAWSEHSMTDDEHQRLAIASGDRAPILVRTPDYVILPRICGDWIGWAGATEEGEWVFSGVPISAIPTPGPATP